MFLNKLLCWFYNEGHQGKVPMDDAGATYKTVIFRKLNQGRLWSIHPKNFLMLPAMKFVPSIITVYLLKSDEIVEPESIHQTSSIPESHSTTNLFNRSMTEEIAVQNFSKQR